MQPVTARQTWRTLEPLHGMIYFVPEADQAFADIGLDGNRMAYFASRAAAMGPVSAEVVIATFYNFNPALVRRVIPMAWSLASPPAILQARLDAVDNALRRALAPDLLASPELAEAAGLARRAAEVAMARPEGRALFAGHASLPWPDRPHLVLWHAQTLLREFRGDGHVAALLLAGLDPVEALVTHAASGDVPAEVLRATRAWPEDDWAGAVDRLRTRGLLAVGDELALSAEGRSLRQEVEDRTDTLALAPYEVLGEAKCERLRTLARPVSQAVVAGGLLNVDPRRYLE